MLEQAGREGRVVERIVRSDVQRGRIKEEERALPAWTGSPSLRGLPKEEVGREE
jgi:hypothetical protein